jgi:DNA-directed RNA polymerase subunit RPC12/RpoP
MEQCTFCGRQVIDDSGKETEDFGMIKRGKYVCARCKRAFEYSLGV